MSEPDPLIRQLREQISDNDRAIVEAINARLKLVARLKSYKESRGMVVRRPRARGVDAAVPEPRKSRAPFQPKA